MRKINYSKSASSVAQENAWMARAMEQAAREEGLRTEVKSLKKQVAEATHQMEVDQREAKDKIRQLEEACAEQEAEFARLTALLNALKQKGDFYDKR